MYSFIYTNKNTSNGKDSYLLHITFNDVILEDQSVFAQFPQGTSQESLDAFANAKIDLIEGLE